MAMMHQIHFVNKICYYPTITAFLGRLPGFHIFFHHGFLGATHFLTAWLDLSNCMQQYCSLLLVFFIEAAVYICIRMVHVHDTEYMFLYKDTSAS